MCFSALHAEHILVRMVSRPGYQPVAVVSANYTTMIPALFHHSCFDCKNLMAQISSVSADAAHDTEVSAAYFQT